MASGLFSCLSAGGRTAPRFVNQSAALVRFRGSLVILPPKTVQTSHEFRTVFLHGPLPKSFHFRFILNDKKTIFRQFPLVSEQKRPKARFRTLGPEWLFW